ncbi:hypothetical protein KEM48_000071 [Puccinia striiformis f. sp. tritici PST-130]|nr:hypothetical protein KEM48_000071 [Puccinia striiformis f. sp. tritici PST-130]
MLDKSRVKHVEIVGRKRSTSGRLHYQRITGISRLTDVEIRIDRELLLEAAERFAEPGALSRWLIADSLNVCLNLGYQPILFRPLTYDNNHRKNRTKNDEGRVIGEDDQVVPGLYVTGWLSTGSKGVIRRYNEQFNEDIRYDHE